MNGVDFSFARPSGAAIKAAGNEFVLRYVPYPGDGGKGLTLSEIADYRANGLAIGLVFESTAGRMFDGYPAGAADANQCERSIAALGFPPDRPIYFACDVDTNPAQLAYVDDYLRGVASVLGSLRTGVYGEYDVVVHCFTVHTAAWLWQTYAWSGGKFYSENDLYQYRNGQTIDGHEVDFNYAYGDDSGLWRVDVAEDDLVMITWCTNQEIRDLRAGSITRDAAIKAARDRIHAHLTTDEPYALADTLYSHLVAPHDGAGGSTQHVHAVSTTSGPAEPT